MQISHKKGMSLTPMDIVKVKPKKLIDNIQMHIIFTILSLFGIKRNFVEFLTSSV